MSHSCLLVFVLVIVTSQSITGVILRPNWFPYFRHAHNKANNWPELREAGVNGNEPIAFRQARNSEDTYTLDGQPCNGEMAKEECFRRMVQIVKSMLDEIY